MFNDKGNTRLKEKILRWMSFFMVVECPLFILILPVFERIRTEPLAEIIKVFNFFHINIGTSISLLECRSLGLG